MSDEENFLSRWSQRKHEAGKPDTAPATGDEPETETVAETTLKSEADEQFDLSTLPKIEDVTESTDITGFLRKGVPESLRNAALRKSWALDPAIRNYVNPALEYAYDWNTPGGVPGTSELAVGTDIVKMVTQIMGLGDSDKAAENLNAPVESGDLNTPETEQQVAAAQIAESEIYETAVRVSSEKPSQHEISVQMLEESSEKNYFASQQEVRRHGTARPKV